jgi:hypothetical protein
MGLFFFKKHMPSALQLILFGLDVFALLGSINEYRWAWIAAYTTIFLNINGVGACLVFFHEK